MQRVTKQPRIAVAPMMERTDRHCRYLLRLLAPHAWLYTEMITAAALLNGDHQRLLRFDPSEHPLALQLGGSDAEELAAAARLGEQAGFDEINLNVGCPSDRVQAGCFGAALMRDGAQVANCIAAMQAAVNVPVTVKTRLGVDDHDSYEFLQGFVHQVAAAGCRIFVVHARKAWLKGLSPKQNRNVPPLDYPRVHRLKADFPELEIIINGGLTNSAAALEQLPHVDGVMLGRAAYHDPMLMADLDRQVFATDWMPSRQSIARRYIQHVETELASGVSFKLMARHLLGLYAGQAGARRWRRSLGQLENGPQGLLGLHKLLLDFAPPTRVLMAS